jgi:hypothetical protein
MRCARYFHLQEFDMKIVFREQSHDLPRALNDRFFSRRSVYRYLRAASLSSVASLALTAGNVSATGWILDQQKILADYCNAANATAQYHGTRNGILPARTWSRHKSYNGMVVCKLTVGGSVAGYATIIDLSRNGAKMTLDYDTARPTPGYDIPFYKYLADYAWPRRLSSPGVRYTVNGTFFLNNTGDTPSQLSFPLKVDGQFVATGQTSGQDLNYWWAALATRTIPADQSQFKNGKECARLAWSPSYVSNYASRQYWENELATFSDAVFGFGSSNNPTNIIGSNGVANTDRRVMASCGWLQIPKVEPAYTPGAPNQQPPVYDQRALITIFATKQKFSSVQSELLMWDLAGRTVIPNSCDYYNADIFPNPADRCVYSAGQSITSASTVYGSVVYLDGGGSTQLYDRTANAYVFGSNQVISGIALPRKVPQVIHLHSADN